jgi:hypothetical protein
MGMIEIPLHSLRYRFRSLTWQEEFRIPFSATEDQRKTLLAHALVDISGLKIPSAAEARTVLDQIPPALLWRINRVAFGCNNGHNSNQISHPASLEVGGNGPQVCQTLRGISNGYSGSDVSSRAEVR